MENADLQQRLLAAISAAERIEGLPEPQPVERVQLLPPLTPCRTIGENGGRAIVKYRESDDEQHVFNILATLLPEGVKLKPEHEGGPRWTWLRPLCVDVSDPTGEYGYVCAKWTAAHGGGSGG